MSEIYLAPLKEILKALNREIRALGLNSEYWYRSDQKNYQHLHQAKLETQTLIKGIV
jgi:hypothetical protein